MAAPVITLADNLFVFTEKANTTGSLFDHAATKQGTITDDNAIGNPPNYLSTFTHIPDPAILPGTLLVDTDITGSLAQNPIWQGTIDFDYSVLDKNLDFLRQGQTLTQTITVRLTDPSDGGAFVDQLIQVQITGANDKPKANLDLFSVSENVTLGKFGVLGNDTDPDLGDSKALTPAGFQLYSVTSAADPFLTTAMASAARINLTNNALPLKNGIQLTFNKAFQALAAGENAVVTVKYGMVDGFGGTSASQLRVTVIGADDAQIVGTTGNDLFLFGEKNADQMFGLAGNDVITPRGGNDTVSLGAGNDIIVFNTAPNSATNNDKITDFNHVADTIRLENAIFTKLVTLGTLNPIYFRAGPHAVDGNDFIVYNQANGALFYDSNAVAAGGAIQFATLNNRPVLAANDFVVI